MQWERAPLIHPDGPDDGQGPSERFASQRSRSQEHHTSRTRGDSAPLEQTNLRQMRCWRAFALVLVVGVIIGTGTILLGRSLSECRREVLLPLLDASHLAQLPPEHQLLMHSGNLSVASRIPHQSDASFIPALIVNVLFEGDMYLRCLRSIDFPVRRIVTVWNGDHPDVAAAIGVAMREFPQLEVYHHPVQLGCAGAWNKALYASADAPWWIVVNHDIMFQPGTLSRLAAHAVALDPAAPEPIEPDLGMLFMSVTNYEGHPSASYSAMVLYRTTVQRVGMFDENLYPAYYEDDEYTLRVRLGGMHLRNIDPSVLEPSTYGVVHGRLEDKAYTSGSRRVETEEARHIVNLECSEPQDYLRLKWGRGTDHHFQTPFGLDLPLSAWHLDPVRRARVLRGECGVKYQAPAYPYIAEVSALVAASWNGPYRPLRVPADPTRLIHPPVVPPSAAKKP
jgi:hypothetical protein